jgi:hypothetical protein
MLANGEMEDFSAKGRFESKPVGLFFVTYSIRDFNSTSTQISYSKRPRPSPFASSTINYHSFLHHRI